RDINHRAWRKPARTILEVGDAFEVILFNHEVCYFLGRNRFTVLCPNDDILRDRGLIRCVHKDTPPVAGLWGRQRGGLNGVIGETDVVGPLDPTTRAHSHSNFSQKALEEIVVNGYLVRPTVVRSARGFHVEVLVLTTVAEIIADDRHKADVPLQGDT